MTTIESSKFVEIELETIRDCPVCGSTRHHKWCDGYDRLHRLSSQCFIYHRCDSCGLVFLALRPKEEDIFKFYPEEYQPYQIGCNSNSLQNRPLERQNVKQEKIVKAANFYNKLGARIKPLINGRLDLFPYDVPTKIQEFYKPSSPGLTLLDFGCGSASFLDQARQNGWRTLGADFSPVAVESSLSAGHEAFLVDSKEYQSMSENSIDFIRMNHVFEHLYSPIKVLKELHFKLKKGGLIHIAVPNPSGFSATIFRSRWRGLDCPRHVMLYSPLLLKKILSDLEFGDFQILHEEITKDCLGSYGYLLNDQGKIDHEEAKAMIYRSDLTTLMHIPMKLAAAFGRADTYHVFARKL
jgi:2-polyprenyl-3-methyl-5-hydroxy-6-metoxy-1,4-benzoquinol methylase